MVPELLACFGIVIVSPIFMPWWLVGFIYENFIKGMLE